jgi:hypothetical protein
VERGVKISVYGLKKFIIEVIYFENHNVQIRVHVLLLSQAASRLPSL